MRCIVDLFVNYSDNFLDDLLARDFRSTSLLFNGILRGVSVFGSGKINSGLKMLNAFRHFRKTQLVEWA